MAWSEAVKWRNGESVKWPEAWPDTRLPQIITPSPPFQAISHRGLEVELVNRCGAAHTAEWPMPAP